MVGFFSNLSFILIGLVHLAVLGFLIWLVYRFVRAHEQLADNTEKIARSLARKNEMNM